MSGLLRSGITTGTCAAAAAKAALLTWLNQKPCADVEVLLPKGNKVRIPILQCRLCPDGGEAVVVKDAGDDPDITNGVSIVVRVTVQDQEGDIVLAAGEGVGTVTKPGLAVAVGQPAINPVPRRMIIDTVREVLPPDRGATVTISIPGGRELARRTLNPTLGIEGGLSIIGTTGIVEPMSEEAFKNSLAPQIHVALALGQKIIVFVPGKIGRDIAVDQYQIPPAAVVQVSNFVGYMLEQAVESHVEKVLLFSHLGKLAKVAAGVFHTHNRMADARMETIAAYAAAAGAATTVVRRILDCATTEAAMPVLQEAGLTDVYRVLAERAAARSMRYVFGALRVGAVTVTLKGDMLGMDQNAREMGAELGWNIKSLS